MNKLMSVIVLMILASATAVVVSGQRCGNAAGGARCPKVKCCSESGWCGDTAAHCGPRCQLDCWSGERSDHRCGSDFGNPPCAEGRCCSIIEGYCGSGYDYCSMYRCKYRCWADYSNDLPLPVANLTATAADSSI